MPKGKIQLDKYSQVVPVDDSLLRKHRFKLVGKDESTRIFHFSALSQEDMSSWMSVLSNAISNPKATNPTTKLDVCYHYMKILILVTNYYTRMLPFYRFLE